VHCSLRQHVITHSLTDDINCQMASTYTVHTCSFYYNKWQSSSCPHIEHIGKSALQLHSSLTSIPYVSEWIHNTTAELPPGKNPSTQIIGWVGPKANTNFLWIKNPLDILGIKLWSVHFHLREHSLVFNEFFPRVSDHSLTYWHKPHPPHLHITSESLE
jgi:hypothetical protein